MSFSNQLNVINTGADGTLDSTTVADIDAMFAQMAKEQRVVLHFHGGLVNKANGLAGAKLLYDQCYAPAGAYPIFFVWESGFWETITHNIGEIAGESFFKTLLHWVTKFALAKLQGGDTAGAKAASGPDGLRAAAPGYIPVETELALRNKNQEPYADADAADDATDLTPEERQAFQDDLAGDQQFQQQVADIMASILPEEQATGEKGVTLRAQKSTRTLMSPSVIEQLQADAAAVDPNAKGIFSAVRLAEAAGKILYRVVRRFLQKRDHGLYCTIVEEILRELYIANVGEAVWTAMKQETADTFNQAPGQPVRGGAYFAQKLCEMVRGGHCPEITLVGHSAGAVFINHFLAHLGRLRQDAAAPLPANFTFKNVLLLAPACTFDQAQPTFTQNPPLFQRLRIFTMADEYECKDVLVPYVYLRSLLYLISGILEKDTDGSSAFDRPVLGMQRYHQQADVYRDASILTLRAYSQANAGAEAWSITAATAGQGLGTHAQHHGGYPEDPATQASMAWLITN